MNTENTKKPEVTLFSVVLMGALMAALGNIIIFSIAKIIHIDLRVPMALNAEALSPLSVGQVALASAFPAFLAGFLYFLMKKLFSHPLRDFLIVSGGFLIFSFGAPAKLPLSFWPKATLELMHVVAAVFIVGAILAYEKKKDILKSS